MAKSNLIQVFNIIKNGESDYQKKIVTNFVSDLLQDALLNISSNHNRPDFDRGPQFPSGSEHDQIELAGQSCHTKTHSLVIYRISNRLSQRCLDLWKSTVCRFDRLYTHQGDHW